VRVFITTCDSASITSGGGTEESCSGPSQVRRVGWGRQSFCFWLKIPWWKRTVKQCIVMIQVWGKSSNTFTVIRRHHSRMPKWPLGLPRQILCEQSPWCHCIALLLYRWHH
jgi:hypothetical protein